MKSNTSLNLELIKKKITYSESSFLSGIEGSSSKGASGKSQVSDNKVYIQ